MRVRVRVWCVFVCVSTEAFVGGWPGSGRCHIVSLEEKRANQAFGLGLGVGVGVGVEVEVGDVIIL